MSLGEAFIDAKADTAGFLPSLEKQLKAVLRGFEAKVKVAPDPTGFAAKLKTELKGLDAAKVKLTADTPALRREIQRGLRDLDPVSIKLQSNVNQLRGLIQRDLRTLDPVQIKLVADVPGLITKLRADLRAAGVFIPVQLRADTTRLVAALKRDLRAIGPIPIRIVPDTSRLGEITVAANKVARALVLPFRAALDEISQAFSALRATGVPILEQLATTGAIAAERLARQFNLAAGAIPAAFESAGRQVALALSAAAASGETSILRLAEVAARTGEAMQGSLGRAAAQAALEIQGPLRVAIDAITKDLFTLSRSGNISFTTMATAGNLAAEKIAAGFSIAAVRAAGGIAEASARIVAAMEAASAGGTGSLESIQAAAARVSLQIANEFRAAGNEISVSMERAQARAAAAFAKITEDSRAAAAASEAAFRSAAKGADAFGAAGVGAAGKVTSALGTVITTLGVAALAATALGTVIGGFGIKAAADLETVKTALDGIIFGQAQARLTSDDYGTSLAGVAQKADDLKTKLGGITDAGDEFRNQLLQFAKVTPFQFTDLAATSQRILALGLNGKQTLGVLRDIGNAVATVGGGDDELKRVALAIAQINSYGKVTADNLNQISNAIPNFSRLQFAKNIAEARTAAGDVTTLAQAQEKLLGGSIASGEGIKALMKTLREIPGAGKIAVVGADGVTRSLDAMERQSLTLKGQLSNLRDTIKIQLATSFEPVVQSLSTQLPAFSTAVGKFLSAISPAVGQVTNALLPLITKLLPVLSNLLIPVLQTVGGVFKALSPLINAFVQGLASIFTVIGPLIVQFAQLASTQLTAIMPQLANAVGLLLMALAPLLPAILSLIVGGLNVLIPVITSLAPLIQFLAEKFAAFVELPGVAEALGALVIGFGAMLIALGPIISLLTTLGPVLAAISTIAVALGSSLAAVAAAALPILGIVAAVVAVIAVLGVLYYKFQIVRDAVDVLAHVVQVAFTLITGSVRLAILALEKLFDAASHIPGIGGAFGKAADAAHAAGAAIDGVRGAIVSVPRNLNIRISADGSQAVGEISRVISALNAAASKAQGKLIGPIAGPESSRPFVANGFGNITPTKLNFDSNLDNNLAGGTPKATKTKAASAADAVKKAAEAAAKKLKTDLAAIGRSVGIGFVDGIVKGSASAINTKLVGIEKAISTAFEKIKTTTDDKLIKIVQTQNIKLQALAAKRDAIAKTIADANKLAADVTASAKAFASLQGLDLDTVGKKAIGRVVGSPAVRAVLGATAGDFKKGLDKRLAELKAFSADIATLAAKGLSKDLIGQLVSGGVENSAGIADALSRADAATVKSINATQAAINAAAAAQGNTAADALFDAGVQAGKGFLEGLKAQQADIIKLMTTIAQSVAATVKKTLKIKSPSRVMGDLGDDTMAGYVNQVEAAIPGVHAALRAAVGLKLKIPTLQGLAGMSIQSAQRELESLGLPRRGGGSNDGGAGMTNIFQITITGTMTPAEARSTGNTLGNAIADTLARRQEAAAFAGTGG